MDMEKYCSGEDPDPDPVGSGDFDLSDPDPVFKNQPDPVVIFPITTSILLEN